MKETLRQPTAAHKAFRDDIVEVLRKHAEHLDAKDMLALGAHMVGQLIALQDQRTMTKEIALQIIARNIEQGNSELIDKLLSATTG